MTAPMPAPLLCPQCRSTKTHVGASRLGLCFDCMHQWNPAEVVAGPAPVLEPFGMAPVDEVFGVPEPDAELAAQLEAEAAEFLAKQIEEAEARHPAASAQTIEHELVAFTDEQVARAEAIEADLIGGRATLEGGQVGTVLAFAGDDHVVIELDDGREELVHLSDVERIIPPAMFSDDELEPAPVDQVDVPPQALAYLAKLITKAAVATPADANALGFVAYPPTGFLPTDPTFQAAVERAAIMAVAGLIASFDLDPGDVLAVIGATLPETTEGDPQQEDNTSDTHTSE